jgi:2-C-methyl-D-erythritol 4-phosphate cytidylyltransferase
MTLDAARQVGAATVAVPVTDTLKRGDGEHRVAGSVDREWLWSIQTPQAFRLDLLLDAHLRARSEGISATDDASLIERVGRPVQLVLGDARNIKVTTPDDLPMAEYLLSRDRESATS